MPEKVSGYVPAGKTAAKTGNHPRHLYTNVNKAFQHNHQQLAISNSLAGVALVEVDPVSVLSSHAQLLAGPAVEEPEGLGLVEVTAIDAADLQVNNEIVARQLLGHFERVIWEQLFRRTSAAHLRQSSKVRGPAIGGSIAPLHQACHRASGATIFYPLTKSFSGNAIQEPTAPVGEL